MNSTTSDEQIRQLLDDTKALLSSALAGDTDEIGRQLEMRQQCIDSIKSTGGFGKDRTLSRQSLINEILSCDKKACLEIRKLTQNYGRSFTDYQKKVTGLLQYSKSSYNLSGGQYYDKKD